jgi:hypothetical protein
VALVHGSQREMQLARHLLRKVSTLSHPPNAGSAVLFCRWSHNHLGVERVGVERVMELPSPEVDVVLTGVLLMGPANRGFGVVHCTAHPRSVILCGEGPKVPVTVPWRQPNDEDIAPYDPDRSMPKRS